MTQDQYGRGQGSGYVVGGEVVPDDETEVPSGEETTPMTRFQKVASALRGDRSTQPTAEQDTTADPSATDPNGTWPARPDEAATVGSSGAEDTVDDALAGTTDGAPVGTTEGSPAGRHAAGAADAGLRPGEATDRIGDFGDIAFGNLLPDAEQYTTQWQQIQFRFVDDPQGSVTEAADVVSQVTAKLEAAIQERQRAIEERQRAIQERASALRGRWGEGANADTETLRETLRMYRAFMDQLIGPTP